MLEVLDINMVYPNGYEALKKVSFATSRGEIVGLIGKSGSGKSTLLRCIDGLQRPTEGRVLLDGVDLTLLDGAELRAARRKIGFIWQEFNVVGRLSALDNVLCGRLGYSSGIGSLLKLFSHHDREIAVRSLERVSLLPRAQQRADRLSGGEKQRVSIARALSQEPHVILADEPVASLDPELSWQIMSLLARCTREEGVPTVIAIHAVDLARAFADRVVGIADGEIVFDGRPEALNDRVLDRVYRSAPREMEPAEPVAPRELVGAR